MKKGSGVSFLACLIAKRIPSDFVPAVPKAVRNGSPPVGTKSCLELGGWSWYRCTCVNGCAAVRAAVLLFDSMEVE
jgi:hypothetical protein